MCSVTLVGCSLIWLGMGGILLCRMHCMMWRRRRRTEYSYGEQSQTDSDTRRRVDSDFEARARALHSKCVHACMHACLLVHCHSSPALSVQHAVSHVVSLLHCPSEMLKTLGSSLQQETSLPVMAHPRIVEASLQIHLHTKDLGPFSCVCVFVCVCVC